MYNFILLEVAFTTTTNTILNKLYRRVHNNATMFRKLAKSVDLLQKHN